LSKRNRQEKKIERDPLCDFSFLEKRYLILNWERTDQSCVLTSTASDLPLHQQFPLTAKAWTRRAGGNGDDGEED